MTESKKDVNRMSVATTVFKSGNSLAIRIPAMIAEKIRITQGSELDLMVNDNLTIELVPRKKRPTLEELVSRITPDNRHAEIDFGGPEGNEVW